MDKTNMYNAKSEGGWYRKEGGNRQIIKAGQGVLTTPGFVHDYGGFKGDYTEDPSFSSQIKANLELQALLVNLYFEKVIRPFFKVSMAD